MDFKYKTVHSQLTMNKRRMDSIKWSIVAWFWLALSIRKTSHANVWVNSGGPVEGKASWHGCQIQDGQQPVDHFLLSIRHLFKVNHGTLGLVL